MAVDLSARHATSLAKMIRTKQLLHGSSCSCCKLAQPLCCNRALQAEAAVKLRTYSLLNVITISVAAVWLLCSFAVCTFKGSCFEGQHMIHAAVAAVTFVLYAVVSVLMVRGPDCSGTAQ
jgi:hypothetical protein